MNNWNDKAKRLLKSELVKRGVSTAELAFLLNSRGIEETKSSIDSKISRGTFSASFLLQCLTVIGCNRIEIDGLVEPLSLAAESNLEYNKVGNEKQ